MIQKPTYEELEKRIQKLEQSDKKARESEERYKLAFQTSPDAINISRASDGMFINVNHGFTKIMGYKQDDVIGKTSLSLNVWENPEDRDRLINSLAEAGYVDNMKARFICKDGQIVVGLISAHLMQINGEDFILSIIRDITQFKNAQKALRESEEGLRAILSATPDPIAIYSNQGETKYLNPAFVELFGWSLDELEGKRIPFVPDDQKQITSEKLKELLSSGKKVQFETKRLTKKGRSIDVIISASCMKDINGKISKLVVILKDITEQKQIRNEMRLLNIKLEHKATHDPLTGAPNRRAILNRLSNELARAKRGNLKLSIGLCDIDHFKHVNDKYGHLVGDDVLCSFVKIIQKTLRPYDLIGRYGGEEFLLVIPDLPGSTGLAEEKIYERVRAITANHKMATRSGEITITISIGITSKRGDETEDAMIARADAALYRAKENGRNQLAFAD